VTWVKICGITNLEDALTAVDAGADALGFVFYEKSPRRIGVKVAREIVLQLPERVEKVGVFVDGSGFEPVDIAREVGLTAIQNTVRCLSTSSPESQMMIAVAGFRRPPKMFLSFPAGWLSDNPEAVRNLTERFQHLRKDGRPAKPEGCFDTFFLDTGTAEQPGGTGKTFDWEKAAPIAQAMRESGLKLVVAGGLTPVNVGEAIRTLNSWGVDVSSGVEAAPGKKDPEKVRAFVRAVRETDGKVN